MEIHWPFLAVLGVGCIVLMLLERRGVPVMLQLNVKNDVRRETMFLQQYGQAACVTVVVCLVFMFGGSKWRQHGSMIVVPLALAPGLAGFAGMLLKRLLGRVRPGYDNAGKFLGPSTKHANWRESFPSNHAAAAMALSVGLAYLFPPAALVFWQMAVLTGVLRWLQDAHWPSDVLGGLLVGYFIAVGTWEAVAWTCEFSL